MKIMEACSLKALLILERSRLEALECYVSVHGIFWRGLCLFLDGTT